MTFSGTHRTRQLLGVCCGRPEAGEEAEKEREDGRMRAKGETCEEREGGKDE